MLTTLEARKLIDQIGLSLAEKMNRDVEEGDLMKLMEQYREDKEEQTNIAIDYPKEMLDEDDLRKLRNLLKSKEPLIKKALGIDTLEVEVKEDRVRFAWFERKPEHDELMIYARFIKKLIEKAKDAAYIHPEYRPVKNEKYAFRCFLLRLDYIGDEYKADRKVLLQNFTGSSAFRDKTGN